MSCGTSITDAFQRHLSQIAPHRGRGCTLELENLVERVLSGFVKEKLGGTTLKPRDLCALI